MALRLRAAREADAATVAALHLASWRDAYRGLLEDDFLDGDAATRILAYWQTALARRPLPGVVFLATIGGDPAGFVAAWRKGTVAVVDNLHVRPGLRGAGIGRALLGQAARRMQGRGCKTVELGVFAGNIDATRFYGELGATIGEPEPAETFGQQVMERHCAWPEIERLVESAARPKER